MIIRFTLMSFISFLYIFINYVIAECSFRIFPGFILGGFYNFVFTIFAN